VLRARTVSPTGLWTPVITERYDKVGARHRPAEGSLPLDFFGTPQHHEMAVTIDVPSVPEGSRAYLHLTMMDVDAPAEGLIFVNGNGPIEPPLGVISGSMTLSDTVEIPAGFLKPGANEVRFRFDNLNEGTSGFIVYDCQVLVD
jgi:hypothetical protein